jgi:hypothetical protein
MKKYDDPLDQWAHQKGEDLYWYLKSKIGLKGVMIMVLTVNVIIVIILVGLSG